MSVYRRLARSKRGMSTIFGGLFFVIIILMGFNVMLWGFIQYDAYNHVITSMSQRDQQAVSENLVPVNATYPTGGPLSIIVNNLGGGSVTIAAIYIWNTNTTGQCRPTPCIFYAPPPAFTYFTNGNIPAGAVNFVVHVYGINVKDGNSYRITLATTRGREFSMYYPWRFSSLIINGNPGGNFVTNVGPLAVYFDFKSFNYTQGTQTTSIPAFCMTPGNSIIYVRVANTSTNATVTIESSTMMQMQPYSANGFGQFVRAWILAPNSINPSTEFAYNYPSGAYVLQPSGPNGPTSASFAILKIGASSQNGLGSAGLTNSDNWLTFIGIYYMYNGQPQGETIPFMDFRTSSGAPVCNS
jgi:hypothetical protein